MRLVRFGLAVALAALLATTASAQEQKKRPGGGGAGGGFGFGGGDGLALVTGQKSVQDELKVSDDQLTKLKDAAEKLRPMRGAGGGGNPPSKEEFATRAEERRKNVEKALTENLKPDQKKRLDQIVLQQTEKNQGLAAALRDTKVADALKLSADQKELLTAINEDRQKLQRESFQGFGGGGGGNREEFQKRMEENRKKMEDFRKSADAKITKTLSDEQKKAWKDLTGAEFAGKIETPMRRPGGGGQ